jgi:Zn-dependent protease
MYRSVEERMDLTRGSFPLFRAAGVQVYVHWLWFVMAWFQVSYRDLVVSRDFHYHASFWKVVEYLALFAIILLHEFGHVLACRSVGGRADQIVLWPLGGVAYVAPPPRPGAVLWSIAAGPLVNFALLFPLGLLWLWGNTQGWAQTAHDVYLFLSVTTWVNFGLFVLNLIPIYPLDGGQILHALFWFAIGRWRSLQLVSILGIVLGGMLFMVSLLPVGQGAWLLSIAAAFMVFRSIIAFQQSRAFLFLLGLPRHDECFCPQCAIGPPRGPFWVCEHCQTRFDLFDSHGKCPACGAWYLNPECPHCRTTNHIDRWFHPASADAPVEASLAPLTPPVQSPPG